MRLILAFLLAISVAEGFHAQAQQPAPDFAAVKEKGQALIDAKDLEGPEQFFRSASEQAHSAKEPIWEAEFNRLVGETFERRHRNLEAYTFYLKALTILEAANGPEDQIARLHTGIGWIDHDDRQDDASAQEHLNKALAGYRELNDKLGEARVLHYLAQVDRRQGRSQDAEHNAVTACSIYQALGRKVFAANCQATLALIYEDRSEYRKALQAAFLALDGHTAPRSAERKRDLDVLGNIFMELEQPEKALDDYRQALEIAEKLDNPTSLAHTLNNVGATLAKLGRLDEALAPLRRALTIERNANDAATTASTLVNIGSAEQGLGRSSAKSTFVEALSIAEQHGFMKEAAVALYSLGNLAMADGKLDEALGYHRRGLEIRRELKQPIDVVWSLNRVALIAEARDDLGLAEKLHQEALDIFEPLLRNISDPLQVSSFRETTAILYPHYSRVLARKGSPGEAFLMAERGRGAGLARMAVFSGKPFVDTLSSPERKEWTAATIRFARATNRLRIQEAQPDATVSLAAGQAQADYIQADRELTDLRDRIFASNPDLRSGENRPPRNSTLSSDDGRHADTLFLEWLVVDEKSSLLFAISSEGLKHFEPACGPSQAGPASRFMADSIGGAGGRGVIKAHPPTPGISELSLARELYDAAFGPAAPWIEGGKWSRLVLASDDALFQFPLAALADASGRRLIERYTVTTAVSFRSLLQDRPRVARAGSMLAVGDPLRKGEDRVIPPSGLHLYPLPYARQEAEAIAQLFPGAHLFVGTGAREAEIKKLLSKSAILHFATHGILDPLDGMRSGLLLSTEPADSNEDGVLQGWEIVAASLEARVAVLSACETGGGDERLGEGLVGLAWAFQAAGCPNVIASLWSVNDASTRELMVAFYHALRRGDALETALRDAMLEERGKPGYESPFYWAAFQLIGPGGPFER